VAAAAAISGVKKPSLSLTNSEKNAQVDAGFTMIVFEEGYSGVTESVPR
jgi:hypothetical protein